jgi:hypothetical protein
VQSDYLITGMKIWTTLLVALVLCGCAHGKVGEVAVPLPGRVSPRYIINIEVISADGLQAEEQRVIEERYAPLLQQALMKRGYRTHLASAGAPSGISLTLSGHVTRYDPGSATKRVLVGFGSGSSSMHTAFTLENFYDDSVVTQFEIIATSGGNGGLQSLRSYLETHLEDGASKAADYLAGRVRR